MQNPNQPTVEQALNYILAHGAKAHATKQEHDTFQQMAQSIYNTMIEEAKKLEELTKAHETEKETLKSSLESFEREAKESSRERDLWKAKFEAAEQAGIPFASAPLIGLEEVEQKHKEMVKKLEPNGKH